MRKDQRKTFISSAQILVDHILTQFKELQNENWNPFKKLKFSSIGLMSEDSIAIPIIALPSTGEALSFTSTT